MDAQQMYRTFRPYALELAAMHDVPIEEALLALARTASVLRISCPLRDRAVCAGADRTMDSAVEATGNGLRENRLKPAAVAAARTVLVIWPPGRLA